MSEIGSTTRVRKFNKSQYKPKTSKVFLANIKVEGQTKTRLKTHAVKPTQQDRNLANTIFDLSSSPPKETPPSILNPTIVQRQVENIPSHESIQTTKLIIATLACLLSVTILAFLVGPLFNNVASFLAKL